MLDLQSGSSGAAVAIGKVASVASVDHFAPPERCRVLLLAVHCAWWWRDHSSARSSPDIAAAVAEFAAAMMVGSAAAGGRSLPVENRLPFHSTVKD